MNKNKKWTEEEIAELQLDFPNQDMPKEKLAEKYGRSWDSIKVFANSKKIYRGHAKELKSTASRLPYEEIIDLYVNKKLSTRDIGKIYEVAQATISILLKKHGVSVKSNVETVRKYYYDQDYFESIDTSEKAYFYGVLTADGYNQGNYVVLGLKRDDEEIIKNLLTAIGSSQPIIYGEKTNDVGDRTYYSATVSIGCTKMCKDLERHGCTKAKSFTVQFPSHFDKSLWSHYIRGEFDGDGSVVLSKDGSITCKWIGSKHTIDGINSALHDFAGTILVNLEECKNTHDIFVNRCTGTFSCAKAYKYMYADAKYYLKRKKEIFDNYFQIGKWSESLEADFKIDWPTLGIDSLVSKYGSRIQILVAKAFILGYCPRTVVRNANHGVFNLSNSSETVDWGF